MNTPQFNDNEREQVRGYMDARLCLLRSADYRDRETAREWLNSPHGKEAARLAFRWYGHPQASFRLECADKGVVQ